MNSLNDLLLYFRQFYPIHTDEFDILTNCLRPKVYAKASCIVCPGDIQRELLFVRKGLQMAYASIHDRQHIIAFTHCPDISAIPDSFCFQQPSQYFLQCLTDSEFLAISYDQLLGIFDQAPAVERLFRKLTEATLAGVIHRHLELHAFTIEERFRSFAQRSPHLLLTIPHKYIASYLYIDPTNFSKLFNSVRLD